MKAHFLLSVKVLKKSFSLYLNHLVFFIKLALGFSLPWSMIFVLIFFLKVQEDQLILILRLFSLLGFCLILLLYIATVKSLPRLEQGDKLDVLSSYLEALQFFPGLDRKSTRLNSSH